MSDTLNEAVKLPIEIEGSRSELEPVQYEIMRNAWRRLRSGLQSQLAIQSASSRRSLAARLTAQGLSAPLVSLIGSQVEKAKGGPDRTLVSEALAGLELFQGVDLASTVSIAIFSPNGQTDLGLLRAFHLWLEGSTGKFWRREYVPDMGKSGWGLVGTFSCVSSEVNEKGHISLVIKGPGLGGETADLDGVIGVCPTGAEGGVGALVDWSWNSRCQLSLIARPVRGTWLVERATPEGVSAGLGFSINMQ